MKSIVFFFLLLVCQSACRRSIIIKTEKEQDFGRELLSSFQNNDVEHFVALMPGIEDTRALINRSEMPDPQLREKALAQLKDPAFIAAFHLEMKNKRTHFRNLYSYGQEMDIFWNHVQWVDFIYEKINQRGADFLFGKLFFSSEEDTFYMEFDGCVKFPRGWLGANISGIMKMDKPLAAYRKQNACDALFKVYLNSCMRNNSTQAHVHEYCICRINKLFDYYGCEDVMHMDTLTPEALQLKWSLAGVEACDSITMEGVQP
jgi:hypothetical protein